MTKKIKFADINPKTDTSVPEVSLAPECIELIVNFSLRLSRLEMHSNDWAASRKEFFTELDAKILSPECVWLVILLTDHCLMTRDFKKSNIVRYLTRQLQVGFLLTGRRGRDLLKDVIAQILADCIRMYELGMHIEHRRKKCLALPESPKGSPAE